MQKLQESERNINRAKISWEQSKQDLDMAKSFIKTNPDTSCLLSNQSEHYIKECEENKIEPDTKRILGMTSEEILSLFYKKFSTKRLLHI